MPSPAPAEGADTISLFGPSKVGVTVLPGAGTSRIAAIRLDIVAPGIVADTDANISAFVRGDLPTVASLSKQNLPADTSSVLLQFPTKSFTGSPLAAGRYAVMDATDSRGNGNGCDTSQTAGQSGVLI